MTTSRVRGEVPPLGYGACSALLKDWRTQPRVPPGSGRPSGQWTSDASGVSFAPQPTPATFTPIADLDGTLKPTPVFLRPDNEDPDTHDIEDKRRRSEMLEPADERTQEGHPLLSPVPGPIGPNRGFFDDAPPPSTPQTVPGTFEIKPLPEGSGGEASEPVVPQTDAVPNASPKLAPGGGGSSTDKSSRDDGGPPCPPQQNDIANGPNESGDKEEYRLSWLINPEGPTPKFSTWTPNVRSKAYFLPSQTSTGRISFDDCKQRNTPTTLPIPGLRRGDMFEIKAGEWGWEFSARKSKGFMQFENQVRNQNQAVVDEGLGRKIYYCVPNASIAAIASDKFAEYKNSRFLVCR